MKYSKNFERDFRFYHRHMDKFVFCGRALTVVPHDHDGVDAKEAFYRWDSTGLLVPTRQPLLFARLVNCKSSINWHIKAWRDGMKDCGESPPCYLQEFINPPVWIAKALQV